MIKRILIANRGEIACRIIRTLKKMSIETIAVFSQADQKAQHVLRADYAVDIGPAAARESYLCQDKIIEVAKKYRADAIHPGYGFLSENSEFAMRCEKEKIIFIGPSAACIAQMGDKSLAKKVMQKNGVRTIPGYEGDDPSDETLKQEADTMGYPLLIKAAGGGGGKGMRLVTQASDFLALLKSAKDESKSSFNNDRVLLEKYLSPVRHIEIQVFADQKGNAVYLFSRDCSIQRRHQKIIEEARAPHFPEALEKEMGEAAVRAIKAIQYTGAGTVEFLLDEKQHFYFMEMNTRLQVEHPVTEMITNQDLVEWQIRIANNEPLPLTQTQLSAQGHALEVRICAENPHKNFRPSTGKLIELHFPKEKADIRIDSGVVPGDLISPYYDSMIAKLIVQAKTRNEAIQKLQKALEQCYILGVHTNVSFLMAITRTKEFLTAELTTGFIDNHLEKLVKSDEKPLCDAVLIFALCSEIIFQEKEVEALRLSHEDPQSPWFNRDGWRLSEKPIRRFSFWHEAKPYIGSFKIAQDHLTVFIDKKEIRVQIQSKDPPRILEINGQKHEAGVFHHLEKIHVFYQGMDYELQLKEPFESRKSHAALSATLHAPMPSTVIEIMVAEGQKVDAGEALMVLEAMKMQHTLVAPEVSTIKTIHPKIGELLDEGAVLIEFQ